MISSLISVSAGAAILIATVAAVSDLRSGTIPNWLTLPPIAVAPVAYAGAFGFGMAIQCIAATLVSGAVPYLLFRARAMGGGDVKLFAALGAVASFEPFLGLHLQLVSFIVALLLALCALTWKGLLLVALRTTASAWKNARLLRRSRLEIRAASGHSVRMGGAVLVGTLVSLLPYLGFRWSHS